MAMLQSLDEVIENCNTAIAQRPRLRSHPPEEVVLQMRKQDDTLEIVVMHYVP